MPLDVYQVDAFLVDGQPFTGNPAAIVPLDNWLSDDVMLAMAKEHNQSETAFFIPVKDGVYDYELRWFTPAAEIELCGHATLASAYVIFNALIFQKNEIRFKTRFAGDLSVEKNDDWLALNFPIRPPSLKEIPDELLVALNAPDAPKEIFRAVSNWYAVFETANQIEAITPDFERLKRNAFKLCITAKGNDVDFVSRFFVPDVGIMEDPVTGSTHCALVPYWANRLGKNEMTARQLSARGGFLKVAMDGPNDRVRIAGQAMLYSKGQVLAL